MRLAPALLLVLLLFSGCTDPGPPPGSALFGAETARSTAVSEWSPDARLVAVLSSEKTDLALGKRGDGLGEAWGYLFSSPSAPGHVSIVVNSKGEVPFAKVFDLNATDNELVRPTGGGQPLVGWKVDSVDVADALSANFPRYYEVAQGEDMELMMVLVQADEGNPFWQVELREIQRTKRLVLDARMDATTGEFTRLRAEPELAEG